MSRLTVRSLVVALALGIGLLGLLAPSAFSYASHSHHTSRRHQPPRPPCRVRGLRVLAQTSGRVRIGWRRAHRGSIPIGGYRVKRDGLVVVTYEVESFDQALEALERLLGLLPDWSIRHARKLDAERIK